MNSNEYTDRKAAFRLAKAMLMERRGGRCFDFPFYRARSKDLPPLPEPDLWQHFVKHGQFEGRPFRCNLPAVCAASTEPELHCTANAERQAGRELLLLLHSCSSATNRAAAAH